MIACEQMGRDCRAVEIDPRYCDVVVRRWQEFTGGSAVLDGDDRVGVVAVHAEYFPDSKSGTPGANTYKVKGKAFVFVRAGNVMLKLGPSLAEIDGPGRGLAQRQEPLEI